MIIQHYSSRFETPRVKLSREAFESSGIGIFSSEKIPFADRTGSAFAQNLTRLLVARVARLQKKGQSFPDGIHIYELGAGTGILAKRVLDLLKSKHPAIYKKIILHLSDISKPMLWELKSSDVFNNHRAHIVFEVLDATNPKFIHKPLLVYFTNLIDSIPYQRHILIKESQIIFEVQIQTSIKKGAQIIDATSYPPKVLEEKEITKLLSSSDIKRRLILAPQILKVLEEETKQVPINESANISHEELKDLHNLGAFLKKDRPFTVNYSYPIRMAIQKIIKGLEDGGFLFFSDFGIVSREYEQDLYIELGSLTAFSVDFPSFVQLAKTAGKTYYLTSNTPGHPQEMLIDTFASNKKMENLFKRESANNTQLAIHDFLESVKTILTETLDERSKKPEKINELYRSLPEEARIDYSLLNDLAFFLLQGKFYKDADFYADLLFKNYGHSVGVFYYLVKGKMAQEHGELEVAEKFFKTAAEGKKGFFAWTYLGELYWKQERYHEYIDAIKEYLKYTRSGNHLRSMFSIAMAQEKLNDTNASQKTLKELIDIGQRLKTISETEKKFLEQAKLLMIN